MDGDLRGRPRPLWVVAVLLAALLAGGCTGSSIGGRPQDIRSRVTPTVAWLSGAAGEGVADGAFATWRDTPVTIAGTWADTTGEVQLELHQLDPGGEYAEWSGSLDIAVGAIFDNEGESWANAARGEYDERWSRMLDELARKWSERPRGTLYIRFAHEWNGSWSPWAVKPDEFTDFVAAWRRFHALKTSRFPDAKLVFCTNGDTSGFTYDWRQGWPGDEYVDVYSTDWYSELLDTGDSYDAFGGPVGLDQHRQFAQAHGKPFAIPEWGNRYSTSGESIDYVRFVHQFAVTNGGPGPGQLIYEIYFNVLETPNDFGIFPRDQSLAPNVSDTYRQLF